jgi:hypothetical protein
MGMHKIVKQMKKTNPKYQQKTTTHKRWMLVMHEEHCLVGKGNIDLSFPMFFC